MEHPLAMDIEEMRRAGYATVDALVARLADPAADPVLRRAGAAAMRSRLGAPPPERSSNWRKGSARQRRSAPVVRRARQQVAALLRERKPARQLLTFG